MIDLFLKRIRELIDKHGQYVQAVSVAKIDPPDAQPFMYTIGNHEHGLPELLIVGTDQDAFGSIMNRLGKLQRDRGRAFEHEERVNLGGRVSVRILDAGEMARTRYTKLVGAFYGTEEYEVRQVLVPDTKGRWPDDPTCDKPYSSQPMMSSMKTSRH